MRLLHTSDWHLGHTLKDVTREHEHAAFLSWLLETCDHERVDAIVITGDVFDSSTPPASAERMWFDWLAAARRRRPVMDIIAIAGNHDSPARLGASASVLRELGVHVIGGFDRERALIPIAGGKGLVAAVPFLRPIDLGDSTVEAIYNDVIARAREVRKPGQALIVTGHLYLAGADPTWASERRIAIGGQESAPARMFPDEISYVALGHMHRAQKIVRETMRYAGAPIPLSLDEAKYKHSCAIIDFVEGRATHPRLVPIPRTIEIVRVGPASLRKVIDDLALLPERLTDAFDATRPYLEVIVELVQPEPRLRQLIEGAIERKRVRLVRLGVEHTGDGTTLGDHAIAQRLAEIDPRDVFLRLWAKEHDEPPTPEVIAAFDKLLVDVTAEDGELLS